MTKHPYAHSVPDDELAAESFPAGFGYALMWMAVGAAVEFLIRMSFVTG